MSKNRQEKERRRQKEEKMDRNENSEI